MRSRIALVLLASAVAACSHTAQDLPDRGFEATNVPVVSRSDYVMDVSAPAGMVSYGEAERLDAWFRSLDLRYGDMVYVDGGYASPARAEVERIAGQYGLFVSPGAPVTPGAFGPDTVRVVVSRTVASVPNCPNWSRPAQPNYNNQMLPNFGCSVNSNMAAMVANPEDLIHGREGSGVVDSMTSAKAIRSYRETAPTGTQGLQDVSTKKDEQ
ncbi:MAG TPA: CpaD family pilus assembly lipoprotein [Sphingomicrobium sp.]|nr:CpaD family pilus assembly lipoprotein [Sphingomicrobium sp.]